MGGRRGKQPSFLVRFFLFFRLFRHLDSEGGWGPIGPPHFGRFVAPCWHHFGSIFAPLGAICARFWRALGRQVALGWSQGLEIPCQILFKTAVFGRSNLNAKKFEFGMHPFAFHQEACQAGQSWEAAVPPLGDCNCVTLNGA